MYTEPVSILLFSLSGIIFGIITGLTPGLHINTVAVIVMGVYAEYGFDPLLISFFIVAMGITHSFMDFIPSIFLGAPSSYTAISMLPGHKMLLKGRGYEALFLTVTGGLFSIIIFVILFPLILKSAPFIYNAIRPYMHIALILVVSYMIFLEKKKAWALFVFLLSGAYGFISINSGVINNNYVLFPVLTGLFGLSTLVLSYKTKTKIPAQRMDVEVRKNEGIKSGFLGLSGGLTAGLFPGLGSSQSAIIVQQIGKINNRKSFMAVLGGINTIDILLSILAIYLIGNPRSGSAVVIQNLLGSITMNHVVSFIGVGLLAAGIASILALQLGKISGTIIQKINYRKLVFSVIAFLLVMTYVFTGFIGLLVTGTGTATGIIPHLVNVKKSMVLGCLLLPTILHFSGLSFGLVRVLGI